MSENPPRRRVRSYHALLHDVVAAVCHDLRGPLNAMLGWTTILRRTAPATMTRGFDVIERNVRLQAWMLDDVPELLRLLSDARPHRPEPTEVEGLVRTVVGEVQQGMRCEVTLTTGGSLPRTMEVDRAALRTALRAVLTHLGRTADAKPSVDLTSLDEHIELRLTEPRRGEFPFDDLAAFVAGDDVTGRFSRGAGLALLAAHAVVDAHGGAVVAAPEGLTLRIPAR